jgi:hypothetical protein
VAPCKSCVNRRFGGTYRLHLRVEKSAIRSSETSVDTRSTRCHIPEDGNLHSHRCENLISYNKIFGCSAACYDSSNLYVDVVNNSVNTHCAWMAGIRIPFLTLARDLVIPLSSAQPFPPRNSIGLHSHAGHQHC